MKLWKIATCGIVAFILLAFFLLPIVPMGSADFTATELYGHYINVNVDASYGALFGFGYAWFPDKGCGNFYVGGMGDSNLFNNTLLFPNYCNPARLNASSIVQNQCATFSLNTSVTSSTVRLLYDCQLSNGTNTYAFEATMGSAAPVFSLPGDYNSLSIVTSSSYCPASGSVPVWQASPNETTTPTFIPSNPNLTNGAAVGFSAFSGLDYDYCVTFSGSFSQTLPSSFITWYQPIT